MASETIVSEIIGLESSNEPQSLELQSRPVVVHFGSACIANLAPEDPDFAYRERVLTNFHRVGLPVYVKVDPVSRTITSLLIPRSGNVVGLYRSPLGDITFLLDSSPKPFVFQANHPKYPYYLHVLLEAQLDNVPIAVTETESGSDIIDIRRDENRPSPTADEFALLVP